MRVLSSIARAFPRRRPAVAQGEAWGVALLSIDPLIVASVIGLRRMPLFTSMPRSIARRSCHFLLGMGWSAHEDEVADGFAAVCRRHLADHPLHRIVVLCNEPGAVSRLRAHGVDAVLVSQNAFVDERIFRPLPDRSRRYDAVYNARFVRWKRHDLARDVARLALLGYLAGDDPGYVAELRVALPRATWVNEWQNGAPTLLGPEAVNEVLNEARVGLCLSAAEGAMFASAEYLLSGLPIVSTPSVGGRDLFFDPDFCVIVEPDPARIGEAVRAMIVRDVPRELVRARTMARVEEQRRRFCGLVQAIYGAHGVARSFEEDWPSVRRHRLVEWVHIEPFWKRVEERCRAEGDRRTRSRCGCDRPGEGPEAER
jgi:glycosyltransferase involved in cell wall biosynthesis